jgi:hypothetical protein
MLSTLLLLFNRCVFRVTSYRTIIVTFSVLTIFCSVVLARYLGYANGVNNRPQRIENKVPAAGGSGFEQSINHLPMQSACALQVRIEQMNSNGAANGDVQFFVTGGVGPYTYTFNGKSNTTGYFSGLSRGNYSYSIKDASAAPCTASGEVVIAEVNLRPMSESFRDTVLLAGGSCTTNLNWQEPSIMFPDTIDMEPWTGPVRGKLIYKGTHKGHGYYVSLLEYKWMKARIATRGVYSGHLVTIQDKEENDFIYNHFRQVNNYGPWIGLYNTGTPGSFAWDNDEPVNYTNWNPGEPNNQGGNTTVINEGFVHIMGWDYLNRWNDIGDISLPFIQEVDQPIISYKQIAGPVKGSVQGPGVYDITYERTDFLTTHKDTFSFKVTVVCNSVTSFCPKDTVINADPNTCMATLSWKAPEHQYADSITILGGSPNGSQLRLKGVYNGHGYYLSDKAFNWQVAKSMATSVGGHLVTITDAGENAFIYNKFRQVDNYGPWIGLYNTGTMGSFAWVTGEPVNYTNWNASEPNNYKGTATQITEPYIHIMGYDYLNRWNDMVDVPLNFIAEFETPKYSYRQVSGPANGSVQKPGVYNICYERINWETNERETCCFDVTVNCAALTDNRLNNAANSNQPFTPSEVKVYPNPTANSFSLRLESENNVERVSIRVMDLYGKLVESRDGLAPASTVRFGSNYRPGVYFAQVMQGNRKLIFKLVKE